MSENVTTYHPDGKMWRQCDRKGRFVLLGSYETLETDLAVVEKERDELQKFTAIFEAEFPKTTCGECSNFGACTNTFVKADKDKTVINDTSDVSTICWDWEPAKGVKEGN